MNILVIGSGGREHALCWKLRQSEKVDKIYCAPGNGGTGSVAENVELNVEEHKDVVDFCHENKVSLVVVGPEAPLAVGITNVLEEGGINVFGPSYEAARMESSKIFAKELMGLYNIPTAAFRVFSDYEEAEEYISSVELPVVVKAYGLAAGKGVVIAETKDEAVAAAREMLIEQKFGVAGKKIIIEEFLEGEEASILVITDGNEIIPLVTSQDHKRVGEGDTGPNTGGMGAYSPAPVIDDELFNNVMETIVRPTIDGLRNEGILYKGVLYVGLMMTSSGPKVLEYNVRFGDPETQVILPRMKGDLAEIMMAVAEGNLAGKSLDWDERDCVCVVLAAGGYPGEYTKGTIIEGCDNSEDTETLVFHAGTKRQNGTLVTSGGRVLNVVGLGTGIEDAIINVYRKVEKISFEGMHYRKDIGYRALERIKK
jgi:phosphoribosylamine--glycine ligase